MKMLLQDSNFIEAPQAAKERKLQVDVYGDINKEKIIGKIVEVANDKAEEMPVIIMLKDIEEC